MKKLFLDTNFIVDYLLREDFKLSCQEFLSEGIRHGRRFYVSYLSIANFAYIARKLPIDQLYSHLSTLSELFTVIGHNKKQLDKAIALKASDFEDALQYQCSKEAYCDCIITRNQKDYTFSDIPVLSAEEFLYMVRNNRNDEARAK